MAGVAPVGKLPHREGDSEASHGPTQSPGSRDQAIQSEKEWEKVVWHDYFDSYIKCIYINILIYRSNII